jgi:hypothetical protein
VGFGADFGFESSPAGRAGPTLLREGFLGAFFGGLSRVVIEISSFRATGVKAIRSDRLTGLPARVR